MAKLLGLLGRALLGAASVLGLFVVVLVGLGVYLVSLPLRGRGLAPRYALTKAVVDVLVAMNALVAAAKDAKPDLERTGEPENSPTPPHTSAH